MELNKANPLHPLPADDAETIIPLLPATEAVTVSPPAAPAAPIRERAHAGSFDGLPWGLWQARTLLLAGACKITTAWHMATVLYASNPSPFGVFGCSEPVQGFWDWTWNLGVECDSSWANVSTPKNGSTADCLSWGRLGSVNQWALACSPRFVGGVSQLFYLLGIWMGNMLCLWMAPRVGPRRQLLLGVLFEASFGMLLSLFQVYHVHSVLRFFMAVACVHVFTAGSALCADVTTGMARKLIANLYELGWTFGIIIVAGMGVHAPNWTAFQATLAMPSVVLFLPCLLLLPESPSWLVSRGRLEDAAKEFHKAAALSRQLHLLPPQPELLRQLQQQAQAAKKTRESEQNVWRAAWAYGAGATLRLAALHVMWGFLINSFFGSLLNVRNLGNSSLYGLTRNMAASGTAGTLGVILGAWIALRTSQSWKWLGLLLTCGGSIGHFAHLLHLKGENRDIYLLLFVLCQRVAVAGGLAALAFLTSTLVRAPLRRSLIFSCVCFGRIWLLGAPFVGNLAVFGEAFPITLFGIQISTAGLWAIMMANGGIFNRSHSQRRPKLQQNHVSIPHIKTEYSGNLKDCKTANVNQGQAA